MTIVIDVIGWFATVLTAIVGIPMVVDTFRNKKVNHVPILSWWIYYLGIFFYAVFGLLQRSNQIIFTQLFSGLTTTIFISQFSIYKNANRQISVAAKFSSLITAFLVFASIVAIAIAHFSVKNISSNGVDIVALLAGLFIGVAFLPQTILGIKNKTLFNIPIFFIVDLVIFNSLWDIFYLLQLGVIPVSAIVLQSIGLAIAVIQMTFYFIQLFDKKVNPKLKIVWI
ncbi:hypothetical protein [Mesomycoplasma conjunctivae]|uniref:hypothetical protein n=1 Tax=Mesomycoplasma conjunctivae TaxID=45361 RepID=UPI003DA272F8